MAHDTDHWTTWQQEQYGTTHRPLVGGWSTIFLLVIVLVIALSAFADHDPAKPYRGPAPCARNWPPTCQEHPGR